MEEIDRLKQEVQAGRLGTEQLLDLVILLQRQLQAAHQRLAAQNQRLAELEQQLDGTTAKGS
jgi:hypothetical protein